MTVGQLLATISSQELTEWAQYFEWKAAREEEDQQQRREIARAERWVREGK